MTAVSPVRTDMPPDLLRVADLTHHDLVALLELAEDMKADPHAWTGSLAGQSVACFFEKPATVADLDLPAGSMGPKVEAAVAFVAATGKRAAIGSLIEAMPIVEASAGTQFSP